MLLFPLLLLVSVKFKSFGSIKVLGLVNIFLFLNKDFYFRERECALARGGGHQGTADSMLSMEPRAELNPMTPTS